MEKRYYLEANGLKRQVSKEEWIKAERAAGFRSKFGDDSEATGGFSNGSVSGSISYGEPKQEEKDEGAFLLLQEVIMLGRNGHEYKSLLPKLKKALAESPKAAAFAAKLTVEIK